MNNKLLKVLILLLVCASMLLLSACGGMGGTGGNNGGGNTDSGNTDGGNTDDATDAQIRLVYAAYTAYTEKNGEEPLDYEAWLESIKGEAGAAGANGLTPSIGENGNWFIGDTDTGVAAVGKPGADGAPGKDGADGEDGKDGITPSIGTNGNWYIGSTDTGVPAVGNGSGTAVIPSIGENGNWIIAGTDTGISATGKPGADGAPGKDGVNGAPGKDGVDGAPGKDGENGRGIADVSVVTETVDGKTYLVFTFTYTDNTTEVERVLVGTSSESPDVGGGEVNPPEEEITIEAIKTDLTKFTVKQGEDFYKFAMANIVNKVTVTAHFSDGTTAETVIGDEIFANEIDTNKAQTVRIKVPVYFTHPETGDEYDGVVNLTVTVVANGEGDGEEVVGSVYSFAGDKYYNTLTLTADGAAKVTFEENGEFNGIYSYREDGVLGVYLGDIDTTFLVVLNETDKTVSFYRPTSEGTVYSYKDESAEITVTLYAEKLVSGAYDAVYYIKTSDFESASTIIAYYDHDLKTISFAALEFVIGENNVLTMKGEGGEGSDEEEGVTDDVIASYLAMVEELWSSLIAKYDVTEDMKAYYEETKAAMVASTSKTELSDIYSEFRDFVANFKSEGDVTEPTDGIENVDLNVNPVCIPYTDSVDGILKYIYEKVYFTVTFYDGTTKQVPVTADNFDGITADNYKGLGQYEVSFSYSSDEYNYSYTAHTVVLVIENLESMGIKVTATYTYPTYDPDTATGAETVELYEGHFIRMLNKNGEIVYQAAYSVVNGLIEFDYMGMTLVMQANEKTINYYVPGEDTPVIGDYVLKMGSQALYFTVYGKYSAAGEYITVYKAPMDANGNYDFVTTYISVDKENGTLKLATMPFDLVIGEDGKTLTPNMSGGGSAPDGGETEEGVTEETIASYVEMVEKEWEAFLTRFEANEEMYGVYNDTVNNMKNATSKEQLAAIYEGFCDWIDSFGGSGDVEGGEDGKVTIDSISINNHMFFIVATESYDEFIKALAESVTLEVTFSNGETQIFTATPENFDFSADSYKGKGNYEIHFEYNFKDYNHGYGSTLMVAAITDLSEIAPDSIYAFPADDPDLVIGAAKVELYADEKEFRMLDNEGKLVFQGAYTVNEDGLIAFDYMGMPVFMKVYGETINYYVPDETVPVIGNFDFSMAGIYLDVYGKYEGPGEYYTVFKGVIDEAGNFDSLTTRVYVDLENKIVRYPVMPFDLIIGEDGKTLTPDMSGEDSEGNVSGGTTEGDGSTDAPADGTVGGDTVIEGTESELEVKRQYYVETIAIDMTTALEQGAITEEQYAGLKLYVEKINKAESVEEMESIFETFKRDLKSIMYTETDAPADGTVDGEGSGDDVVIEDTTNELEAERQRYIEMTTTDMSKFLESGQITEEEYSSLKQYVEKIEKAESVEEISAIHAEFKEVLNKYLVD